MTAGHNVATKVQSTYSNLAAEGYPDGVRSWIATGTNGDIYVAFFNLNDEKTTISANIVDLAIVQPGGSMLRLCGGIETWSETYVTTNDASLSAEVAGHGSALFVLRCF
ncbi:hypothetical protein VIGAN_03065700 [Vigna angularis var. angularis]|uniref:Alpha galactosidase C-terminal domain-containing protein n=1 Tax=Vigna angularis var. angularis TaxID=157739 RepID=A0A0S3RKB7_PHAAN|nr:uncharacterized protein LOC128197929 [Vigna angularis]BAT81015.1 hypothetical protein VIGAN_03065700 [Vigna angularis var. angularis]